MFDNIKFNGLLRPSRLLGCVVTMSMAMTLAPASAQPTMIPAIAIATGQMPEQLTFVLDLAPTVFNNDNGRAVNYCLNRWNLTTGYFGPRNLRNPRFPTRPDSCAVGSVWMAC